MGWAFTPLPPAVPVGEGGRVCGPSTEMRRVTPCHQPASEIGASACLPDPAMARPGRRALQDGGHLTSLPLWTSQWH